MNPKVQAFFDEATNTVSYIVSDPTSGQAAIIDPVLDYSPNNGRVGTATADAMLAVIEDQGLSLAYLLETHAHADHLSSAHHMHERTGAPIVIGEHITAVQRVFAPLFEADDVNVDGSAFGVLVYDGQQLALGELLITAMHTPGHTPACMTYLIGDAAFVGDTLFMPDYGTARADFPGGDAATLYHSIQRILALPPETRIFVGHDYLPEGRANFLWETTVAAQRASNIHVHDGIDEQTFVSMRQQRDAKLDAPRLILPSLQVNIRAGAMPPPSDNGHRFLRIPINAI